MTDKGMFTIAFLVVGVVSSMLFGRTIEGNIFPVSVDFTLDENPTVNKDSELVFSGKFENVRDCDFSGLAFFYVRNDKLRVRSAFIRNDQPPGTSKTRGLGIHVFGPWVLSIPKDAEGVKIMEIDVDHRCHPLWMSEPSLPDLPFLKLAIEIKKNEVFAPFLTLAVMAALTTASEARLLCGPAERMFTALQAAHNEFPVGGGKSETIGSTILVMSKVGSWSLVKVYAANRVCVIDSGNGWYFYKGETPKVYKWGTAPS